MLVNGVAQLALGAGRVLLAATDSDRTDPDRLPSARETGFELIAWNLSTALVILGVALGAVTVVVVGSLLLVTALVVLLLPVRGGGWPVWAYRTLVLVLLVSIPIGVVLSVQK